MNIVHISGELVNEPKVSIINEPELKTVVCMCIIRSCRNVQADGGMPDYIQAAAFGERAKILARNFTAGSGIRIHGCMLSHLFEESGGTKHFINILLACQISPGDGMVTEPFGIPVHFHGEMHDRLAYETMCRLGYPAVNEDDYYDLARERIGKGQEDITC